jgi:hypothetical protein
LLVGVVTVPALERVLVEDDIVRHVNPAISWIVQSIHLASGFIPDEDHLESPVIQVGEVRLCDLHVCDAAEHPKMMHRGLLAMPSLVRRLAIDIACR